MSDDSNQKDLEKQLREKEIDVKVAMVTKKNKERSKRHKVYTINFV